MDCHEDSLANDDSKNSFKAGKSLVWHTRPTLPAKSSKVDFNVWSFVKQCIGKDLTRISMPVALNEPISFLQRIAEYMEYCDLINEALKQTDPIRRMEYICAFAVSATSSNYNRTGKPFNPLLGETYELHHNNFTFVSEQVSHHPPVSAFHVEAEEYRLWSTVQFNLRFWGKSVEVQPQGCITLKLLKYNEVYTWKNPDLTVHNVLMGKLWIEHVGQMKVTNHNLGMVCQLQFHPYSWFSHATNRVTGQLLVPNADTEPTVVRQVFGNWTRGLFTVEPHVWAERESVALDVCSTDMTPVVEDGSVQGQQQSLDRDFTVGSSHDSNNTDHSRIQPDYGFELLLPSQRCIWMVTPRADNAADYYNFTQFAMGLNELTRDLATATYGDSLPSAPNGSLSVRRGTFLPPTDSRFRPDIRALECGQMDAAAMEKNRLEEKQRRVRKLLSQHCRKNLSTPNISISKPICRDRHMSNSTTTSEVSVRDSSHRINSSCITVGPVWFKPMKNELTGVEEWLFTGDYWSRDWKRCPDIY